MAVPNKCQSHIMDHMRCNCSACMDFACKWRKAVVREFKENVKLPLQPCHRKARRWAPRLRREGLRELSERRCDSETQPPKSGVCSRSRPTSRSPCARREPRPRRRVSWWFGEDGDNDPGGVSYGVNNCKPGTPCSNSHERLDVFDGDPQLLRWNQRRCSNLYPIVSAKETEYIKDKERTSGFDTAAMDGTIGKSTLKAKRDGDIEWRNNRKDQELIPSGHNEDTMVLRKAPDATPSGVSFSNRGHVVKNTKRDRHCDIPCQENDPYVTQTGGYFPGKYKHRVKINENGNKRQEEQIDRHDDLNVSCDDSYIRRYDPRTYSSRRHDDDVNSSQCHNQSRTVSETHRRKYDRGDKNHDMVTSTKRTPESMKPHRRGSPGSDCRYSDTSSNTTDTRSIPNNNNTQRSSPRSVHFPACRPFCPSDKVMAMPKIKDEKEWFTRHLGLMNECGLECHATARERTMRMLQKADGLKRSLDRTCLDFGDTETRMEGIRKLQNDYLNTSSAVLGAIRNDNIAARRGPSRERDYATNLPSPQRYHNNDEDDSRKYRSQKTYRPEAVPDRKHPRHYRRDKCREDHRSVRRDDVDDLNERCDTILSYSSSSASNDTWDSEVSGRRRRIYDSRYKGDDRNLQGKGDLEKRNGRERFLTPSHAFDNLDTVRKNKHYEREEKHYKNRDNSDDNDNKHLSTHHGERRNSIKLPPSKRERRRREDRQSSYSNQQREDAYDSSRRGHSPLVLTNDKGALYFIDERMGDDNKEGNNRVDDENEGNISLHRRSPRGGKSILNTYSKDGIRRHETCDFNDRTVDDNPRRGESKRGKEKEDCDENVNVASYGPVISPVDFRKRKTVRDKWRPHSRSEFTGYDSDGEDSRDWTVPRPRSRRWRKSCGRSCSGSCHNRNCNQNRSFHWPTYTYTDNHTDDNMIGLAHESNFCSSPYSMLNRGSKERHYGNISPLKYVDNSLRESSAESDLQSSGYFSD